MNIELRYLLPVPLKERLLQRDSAVWNQHLVFQQGEYIKILAPSGTGKTTLIHTLFCMRDDYEGDVLWEGISIKQLTREMLAEYRQKRLSIVFQDLRLFEHLTAYENIDLARTLQPPVYAASKIDEYAERLGIQHILQQQTGLCSYGEQQRIAIARSLIKPFDWLLMDEPFSHLDSVNREKAIQLIQEICIAQNAGIVLTDLHRDNYFSYSHQLNL